MNKKVIGLIIVIIILLCTVAVGTYLLTPKYKTFSDENIQVEIPNDVNFVVNRYPSDEYTLNTVTTYFTNSSEKNLSIFDIIYMIFNPKHEFVVSFTEIDIDSVNPTYVFPEDAYNSLKKDYTDNKFGYTIVDSSKHNYNGTIYNMTNQTGAPTMYGIMIFDATNKAIITLQSNDLDTVIHMAETFKLK